MNKKIFGTDGIRSLSNDEIFNNLSLNTLSKAILKNNKNLKIVIGRDTRESSKEIESNFINALKNNGAKIFKKHKIEKLIVMKIYQRMRTININ